MATNKMWVDINIAPIPPFKLKKLFRRQIFSLPSAKMLSVEYDERGENPRVLITSIPKSHQNERCAQSDSFPPRTFIWDISFDYIWAVH